MDDNVVFTLAELHSQLRRLPSNGAQHPEACAPETMLQKAMELMKRKDHEVAPWAKGDAPEFLHTILEVLLGDGRASSPEGSKVADGDTRGRHQRPTAAPSGGGGRYYTPAVVCLHRALANLIETKSKQVLTCQVCQHRKPAVYQQGFTIFPLLLHGANGHQIDSLTEAISNHFQPGVCECACEDQSCKGNAAHDCRTTYQHTPDLVFFQLMRKGYDPQECKDTRDDRHITFGTVLRLGALGITETPTDGIHKLFAVLVQHSKDDHYTTYIYTANKWYLFNDSTVTVVTETAVLRAKAYLLVYRSDGPTYMPAAGVHFRTSGLGELDCKPVLEELGRIRYSVRDVLPDGNCFFSAYKVAGGFHPPSAQEIKELRRSVAGPRMWTAQGLYIGGLLTAEGAQLPEAIVMEDFRAGEGLPRSAAEAEATFNRFVDNGEWHSSGREVQFAALMWAVATLGGVPCAVLHTTTGQGGQRIFYEPANVYAERGDNGSLQTSNKGNRSCCKHASCIQLPIKDVLARLSAGEHLGWAGGRVIHSGQQGYNDRAHRVCASGVGQRLWSRGGWG